MSLSLPCPSCGCDEGYVKATRRQTGNRIFRIRECMQCHQTFYTSETFYVKCGDGMLKSESLPSIKIRDRYNTVTLISDADLRGKIAAAAISLKHEKLEKICTMVFRLSTAKALKTQHGNTISKESFEQYIKTAIYLYSPSSLFTYILAHNKIKDVPDNALEITALLEKEVHAIVESPEYKTIQKEEQKEANLPIK